MALAAAGMPFRGALVGKARAELEEWNYSDLGPETWPEHFPTCGGTSQTPINIVPASAVTSVSPLSLAYQNASNLDVFNNGHTVQAGVTSGGGTLSFEGSTYSLLQFHVHTPSEHYLDGADVPLELHFVHRSEGGSLAVLGLFAVPPTEHEELEKVWAHLPEDEEAEHVAVTGFNLNEVIPEHLDAFHYSGSLTNPPCTEGVAWFVAAEPIRMSSSQLREVRNLFRGHHFPNGNRRPLQPLNGRTIYSVSRT